MFNIVKLIFFIFFLNFGISFSQDNVKVVIKKLEKGDTLYKVFYQVRIKESDSKLFINSLQRRLDLTKIPTGQEIKFYFTETNNSLIAVAVPLKRKITVLSWRYRNKINSARISDTLVDDRVQAIVNFEEFKPKPGLYKIKVNKGDNLTRLLSNSGVNNSEIYSIIKAVSSEVDLRKLRPNDELKLFYSASAEGVGLEKLELTMSGNTILIKKDDFKVFRYADPSQQKKEKDKSKILLNESKVLKGDTILGQLRDSGWSIKEARKAVDAFSTVYDPRKISIGLSIIFPKDIRIKAFAIEINKKSAVVVNKIENEKFLAQKKSTIDARRVVSNLKYYSGEDLLIKEDKLVEKKIIKNNINTIKEESEESNDLYFATNLIEGKFDRGDTLLARLIALGEKRSVIRKALKSLSKKMNPNIIRSGSSIIVALGTNKKPMKGFFIEKSKSKGYLVILDNNNYLVRKSSFKDAKIELAEMVKPNLAIRKKIKKKIPDWKNESLIKPFQNNVKIFTFKSGDTLSHAFSKIGISENKIFGFINKLKNEFDPRKLHVGQKIKLYLNKENDKEINGIAIHLNKIRSIEVFRNKNEFILNKYQEPTVFTFHKASGEINSSLYLAAKNAGLPIPVLMEVVKIYSFDVDFQREIKSGDSFEVLYNLQQNQSGEVVSSGPVLRSVLVLGGERLPLYRFEYDKGYSDYFDSDASSVRKALMRTPLDGARISSGFGKRKHPILGYTKMHKGVDFAAPRNTPVFAAGDGIIEVSRRNGGYGNYIRIRHNSDYKTSYAHLASFGKYISEGKRVKQGDVIGYVGTTGRSTGPHLHYEIIFRNKQVNPLKVRMPQGLKLKNKIYDLFIQERDKLDGIWDSL